MADLVIFIYSSFLSFLFLLIFRKLADKLQLLDFSNDRKQHQGAIPLIGGLAIFCAFLSTSLLLDYHFSSQGYFFYCAGALVLMGLIDDKLDISYKVRLSIQVLTAFSVSYLADLRIENLGIFFTNTSFYLPSGVDYFITVLAIVGAINAFNMIDGLDGLLGCLSSVSLFALCFSFLFNGDYEFANLSLLAIAILFPYILLNIGIPFGKRFQIFMGDSGSTLLGFSIVWLLIYASQMGEQPSIQTPTALWFIALPLMDMAAVMCRRVQSGLSPFEAGRDHIHHILLKQGFSPVITLFILTSFAILMAVIGMLGEVFHISSSILYSSFILCFAIYYHVTKYFYYHLQRENTSKLHDLSEI